MFVFNIDIYIFLCNSCLESISDKSIKACLIAISNVSSPNGDLRPGNTRKMIIHRKKYSGRLTTNRVAASIKLSTNEIGKRGSSI